MFYNECLTFTYRFESAISNIHQLRRLWAEVIVPRNIIKYFVYLCSSFLSTGMKILLSLFSVLNKYSINDWFKDDGKSPHLCTEGFHIILERMIF